MGGPPPKLAKKPDFGTFWGEFRTPRDRPFLTQNDPPRTPPGGPPGTRPRAPPARARQILGTQNPPNRS